jgi:hypothetical protein
MLNSSHDERVKQNAFSVPWLELVKELIKRVVSIQGRLTSTMVWMDISPVQIRIVAFHM